ncbi:unnamed protein product [Coccothraustes coccothraustes]
MGHSNASPGSDEALGLSGPGRTSASAPKHAGRRGPRGGGNGDGPAVSAAHGAALPPAPLLSTILRSQPRGAGQRPALPRPPRAAPEHRAGHTHPGGGAGAATDGSTIRAAGTGAAAAEWGAPAWPRYLWGVTAAARQRQRGAGPDTP